MSWEPEVDVELLATSTRSTCRPRISSFDVATSSMTRAQIKRRHVTHSWLSSSSSEEEEEEEVEEQFPRNST